MFKTMFWIALLLALFAALPSSAQLKVNDISMREDRGGTDSIATVALLPDSAFVPIPNGLSAGFTRSVHWLRVKAQAPQGASGDWWLEIHPGYLDEIRLYAPDPARPGQFIERRTGDIFPFSQRESPYRGFLFRVTLTENELHTFHIRLQTTSTSLMMLKIWPVTHFYAAVFGEYALLGAALGLLTIILLINLIYWWHQRDSVILQYIAYIAAALINSIFVQGFAAQFLLPDSPALVNDLQNVSSFLMTAAAGRLYQSVLMIERRHLLLRPLYITMTALPLLLMVAIPLGYFTEAQRIVIAYAMFMTPVSLLRSLQLLRHSIAGGAALVVATMSSVVAIALATSQLLGFFSHNFAILHAFLIGIIGNVIALHLAIGARTRAEKILHQKMAAHAQQSETRAESEMRAREEQANFISMITHEIKTPLSSIAAAADAMEILVTNVSADVTKRLDRIRKGVLRVNSIFDRYLQMDRADNARLLPNFQLHSLHDVIERAALQHPDSPNRLRVHPTQDVDLVCDADLLATAILNIIDNAMKYSPADEPVDLTTALVHGEQIVIEVIDSGPGIHVDQRETIFHRYIRSPEHVSVPGIGVGLSLVRTIAAIHHGSVTALDSDGGGARFRFTLPLSGGNEMSEIDS
jgi:signal transduction histidine kinase